MELDSGNIALIIAAIIVIALLAMLLYWLSTGRQKSAINSTNEQSIQPLIEQNVQHFTVEQKNNIPTEKPTALFTLYKFFKDTCVHCNNFKPVWDELAAKMVNNDIINIVEIDVTNPENEQLVFYYNVEGLPTVILVTPNSIVEYPGNRTLQDLENFIESNIQAFMNNSTSQTPNNQFVINDEYIPLGN